MSQLKIYTKSQIASKQNNQEHNCNLQEFCNSRDVGRKLLWFNFLI